MNQNFFSFSVKGSQGEPVSLERYRGQVVVMVNVASKCGFTPQYKGLEELYQKYKDKGFVILGFPCNQFGGQEPGSDQEIQSFCQMNYGVSFPVMGKVEVNGDHADPVYKFAKQQATGILGSEAIKWNFTKFLVNREGRVVERFAPQTEPVDLAKKVEEWL